jgi:multiple sugar transport system substrate-binding protein
MSKGILRVALVEGERYSPLYNRLDEFTRKTGWEVEATRLPLPELIDHLDESASRYNLVSAHSRYHPGLAPRLAPLDDLIGASEIDDFGGEALEMCRWDGRLYGLPRSVETRLLFYRSDIFDNRREKQWFAEASGGRELSVPQSWEELAVVAQYFTRTGRQEGSMYGFAFPGKETGLVSTFAEILSTVGGTYFDAEGQPRFYSRAGEWTLTLLRDLHGKWQAVPPETPQFQYEEVSELFRMGRCAMICDFPGTARLLCDPTFSAVAGWHSIAMVPAGPGGRRAVWTGCPTFAIPAASPNAEAAVELLLFLTSPESQLLEAKHGAIPSRDSAYRQVKAGLREGSLAHLRFTLAEQTLETASLTAPRLPHYREIEERLWPLLQQAITGEREVTEALEQGYQAALSVEGTGHGA